MFNVEKKSDIQILKSVLLPEIEILEKRWGFSKESRLYTMELPEMAYAFGEYERLKQVVSSIDLLIALG